MKIINKFNSVKKGASLLLVAAILLNFAAITAALVLSKMQVLSKIPVEIKLKADYEMESAIIIEFQKIRNNYKNMSESFSIPSQIVAPGLELKVVSNKIATLTYMVKAQISGESFYKSLSAKIYADKGKNMKTWHLIYTRNGL